MSFLCTCSLGCVSCARARHLLWIIQPSLCSSSSSLVIRCLGTDSDGWPVFTLCSFALFWLLASSLYYSLQKRYINAGIINTDNYEMLEIAVFFLIWLLGLFKVTFPCSELFFTPLGECSSVEDGISIITGVRLDTRGILMAPSLSVPLMITIITAQAVAIANTYHWMRTERLDLRGREDICGLNKFIPYSVN